MKPTIGLIPLVDESRDSLWMLPGYPDGITFAGGIALTLPLTSNEDDLSQVCALCDGFLLTGGHDVSPGIYGEEPLDQCGACSEARDAMEKIVLRIALSQDKPILGICRGIQFLNAALGGDLYQDLPTQHPSEVEHHQTPPYDEPIHCVHVIEDTPLFNLLRKHDLRVNSYHHQAVRTLARDLRCMAVSSDGLTEAVWMPGHKFVWGVQWHPEFAYRTDPDCAEIFRAFVDACGRND